NAGAKLAHFIESLKVGDWKSAIVSVVMETESFAKGMELVGKVLGPVIALFDNVLRPVIEFITGIWNAIMRGLSSISIFGWKPFGGLEKNIVEFDNDKGKG